MHLLFDWDGTIAKKEVAEEASLRRCKILDIAMTSNEMRELQKTHGHFDVNNAAVEKYTGVTDRGLQTIISTNLYQFHYLGVVHEWKERVFYDGMLDVIKKLHAQGTKLTIISTIRQDIIEPALVALGLRNLFKAVYGNTPDLAYTKEQLAQKAVAECGKADYVVGDREDDLKAGRAVNAKTAFAQWGHGELKDKKLADKILTTPTELLNL